MLRNLMWLLVVLLALPAHAQSPAAETADVLDPRFDSFGEDVLDPSRVQFNSIELDSFQPDSMPRNDIASASVVILYNLTDGSETEELLVTRHFRNLKIRDVGRLGDLSVPISISNVLRGSDSQRTDLVVRGSVRIPGELAPFASSVFGRTLSVVIYDPVTGRESPPRRLRVYGLSNQEWFYLQISILYVVVLLAGYYYLRRRRFRFGKVEALERELERAKDEAKTVARQAQRSRDVEEIVQSTPRRARPSSPVPEIPDRLARSLASGQAVLSIGGGLAQEAGRPGWREILNSLYETLAGELTESVNRLFLDMIDPAWGEIYVDDLSDLMDALTSHLGRKRLISEMRAIVERRAEDPTLYRLLARSRWSGVLSLAIDGIGRAELLEKLINDSSNKNISEQDVIVYPSDGKQLRDAVKFGEPFFIKALGDLNAPETVTLSLTEMRETLGRSPEFARQMPLLFDTQCFLFVGVSPDEIKEYLQLFNPGYRQETPKHYALAPFEDSNDRFVDTLARYGVELLEYDAVTEEDALAAFIRKIEETQEALTEVDTGSQVQSGRVNAKIAGQKIRRLTLQNIGPFSELDIKLGDMVSPDGAEWTVILGENGVGKTGILRAIGVALSANEPGIGPVANGILKNDTDFGNILLELDQQTLSVELIRNRGRSVQVRTGQTSALEAGQILVLGFPALRGAPSQDPGGPSSSTLARRPSEPADVMPLLTGDIDPRMSDFKQWIINVLNNSGRDERLQEIRELLDRIVAELVPGGFKGFDDLDINHTINLIPADADQSPVPFSSVSQGMSSIFNWIGVLAKRLYEFYEIDGEVSPHLRPAIVLIDEIDAHLHPDWQRRLVDITKEFFPSVQVIATTHSAMIAGSLQATEIKIVEREGAGSFIARTPNVETLGQSADFIMQSDVIGMDVARSMRVEEKITEYNDLYDEFARDEKEEERLEELSRELADLGWSGVSRSKPKDVTDEDLAKIVESFEKK